jgi:hypothetical protein
MTRSEQERTRIVRAWLDEGSTELSPHVREGVLYEFPTTPQDRPFGAPWSPRMSTFAKLALATVAVVLAFIAGTRFAPGGGPAGPGSDVSASASVIPRPTQRPTDDLIPDVGFIGLPPPGAAPSAPESGELVTSFMNPDFPPFKGMARLYADGRLIWFRYGIGNEPYDSSGYLEQRLTPEGVELVRMLAGEPVDGRLRRLDPRILPDVLPENAWADITVRPYIPRGFAACLIVENWEDPFQELTLSLPEKLAMLPAAAADILRDRERVPSDSYDASSDCLGMTTAEARLLDAALSDAGLAQGGRNSSLLEYHIVFDSAAPNAWRLGVWFEPILPDGTIGCTSCG